MPARKSLKDRNKAAITGPVVEPVVEPAGEGGDEPGVEPGAEAAAPVAEEPNTSQPAALETGERAVATTERGGAARRPQALPAGTARLGLYLRQATLEGANPPMWPIWTP